MSAQLNVINFFEHIKTAPIDPAVEIRVVKVTGDELLGLDVVEPGPQRNVTTHYPHAGNEIYQIVHGDDVVAWNTSVWVRSGDCFTVQEGQVYPLENTGSLPMIAIIICPAAYIGHDRFIIKSAIPH